LYMIKFMRKNKLQGLNILDIASPHMMAYYLSENNHVLKTNIDIGEKKFIKENKNLTFKIEDATKLSFPDNTFDVTYSISVIEHIYKEYGKAISEMIRVTKKDGYIYLTFPVSNEHKEEWVDWPIYSKQKSHEDKIFFQYRFCDEDVNSIIKSIKNSQVVSKDIFWEKKDGTYNKAMGAITKNLGNKYLNFIKNIFINSYYGLTMFPSKSVTSFSRGKPFGNIHLVLKKLK